MTAGGRHRISEMLMAVVLLGVPASARGLDSAAVEKSPSRAVLYSMLLPGAGQVYNGKYVKAVIIFAAQVAMAYQFHHNLTIYNRWEPDQYELPRHRYRDKRNKYAWWTAFVYIYNILDALVDSHLSSFNVDEFEEVDPQPVDGHTLQEW